MNGPNVAIILAVLSGLALIVWVDRLDPAAVAGEVEVAETKPLPALENKWTLPDSKTTIKWIDTVSEPAPLVILRASDAPLSLTVNGKHSTVVVNMDTGEATITGDVNEAARTFWRAVASNTPECLKLNGRK